MKKLGLLLMVLSLVACGGAAKEVTCLDAVEAAYATVEESNQVAMMDMDKDTVISVLGLDETLVEDAAGKGAMMSTHVDMIVAIEAKEGNVDALEDAVETFSDNLKNDRMQYPMNLAAIQGAEVFTEGNNVYYVRLNSFDIEASEDELAKQIEAINEKAEKAIEALHE